jgi:hypothetical protein
MSADRHIRSPAGFQIQAGFMSQTPHRQGSTRTPLDAGSDQELPKVLIDATSRSCQQMASLRGSSDGKCKSPDGESQLRQSKRRDDLISANDEVCREYWKSTG